MHVWYRYLLWGWVGVGVGVGLVVGGVSLLGVHMDCKSILVYIHYCDLCTMCVQIQHTPMRTIPQHPCVQFPNTHAYNSHTLHTHSKNTPSLSGAGNLRVALLQGRALHNTVAAPSLTARGGAPFAPPPCVSTPPYMPPWSVLAAVVVGVGMVSAVVPVRAALGAG